MKKYLVIALASSLILTACNGESESSGGQSAAKNTPQAWVDAHNIYRKKHQVADLQWSDKIAKSTQAFVDKCPSGHSGSNYGENMAYSSNKQTAKDVVRRWYVEENKYDYNNPEWSNSTGHFTQVVWKKTTEVGCAQASNCGGDWADIVVCQYNPAGNVTNSGRFAENVLPPQ